MVSCVKQKPLGGFGAGCPSYSQGVYVSTFASLNFNLWWSIHSDHNTYERVMLQKPSLGP